jgi:DNA mismatch repair ATPase MutS
MPLFVSCSFSLLDRTHSVIGRRMLRQWMLQPSTSHSEILRRQAGISLMLRPELQETRATIVRHLRKIRDIDRKPDISMHSMPPFTLLRHCVVLEQAFC